MFRQQFSTNALKTPRSDFELEVPSRGSSLRLFGREASVACVLTLFESVCHGQGETLLLPGPSGIGKTSFARVVREPTVASNGFFLEGKFDQYGQNVPFAAFRQILSQFCHTIRNEGPERREVLKKRIVEASGDFAQLLIDLEPAFESLIGPQPPIAKIGPGEAKQRFARVIRSFFETICRPEHPVVLFLDDWQWADTASLDLLAMLHCETPLQYLFIIAAYRNDELEKDHQFFATLEELEAKRVRLSKIALANLTASEVTQLVSERLAGKIESLPEIVELVLERTSGNPFFCDAFLDFLMERDLIKFDKSEELWRLERAEIELDHPADVVSWYARRLDCLDDISRNLLSLSACLGHSFDAETLAIISGQSIETCVEILTSSICSDFVVAAEDQCAEGASRVLQNQWRFRHDRIQQAAYALIDPSILPSVRLQIARLLLNKLGDPGLSERLFEVVEHLNVGANLIEQYSEATEAIQLNLRAAQKARGATAYRAELQFLYSAKSILADVRFTATIWKIDSRMAIQLLKELSESAFFDGKHESALCYIREAVYRSDSVVEKADLLTNTIVFYTLLAKYPQAIATGRETLALLGINLPSNDYSNARDQELAELRQAVREQTFEALDSLPVMTEPHWCVASKVLIAMGPPCYRSHQSLWSVIVPKVVNLTLQYGHIPQVGYSHTAIAGLLVWGGNDFSTGKGFSELATRLMSETFTSPTDRSVFHLMAGSSVRHWFGHLKHSSDDYELAYRTGLNSGNLQYAAYAFGHNMYCRFFQGTHLATLAQETKNSLVFSRTRRNQWAADLLEAGSRVVDRITCAEKTEKDSISESEFCRRIESNQNHQVVCIYRVMQSFISLVMQDFASALNFSDEADVSIHMVGTQGLLPWPEHVATRFIIRTSLFHDQNSETQALWRVEFEKTLAQLDVWSQHAPENFEHKRLVANAEIARLDGQILKAAGLFDDAIAAARAGGFRQWEALANELAKRMWHSVHVPRMSQSYARAAYQAYSQWGATAKTNQMESHVRDSLVRDIGRMEVDLPGIKPPNNDASTNVIDRQVEQMRAFNAELQDAQDDFPILRHAEELAQATDRLRTEVAQRKNAESALRCQNDILEQRVTERTLELQKSRDDLGVLAERLELATRAKGMGIWDWNIRSDQLLCDDLLCSLYGIDRDKFCRTLEGWLKYVVPSDLDLVKRAIQNSLDHGSPFNEEFRIRRTDGKVRTIRAERQVIRDATGVPVRMIGVSYDVTENRRQSILQTLRQEVSERVARGCCLEDVLHFLARSIDDLFVSNACAFVINKLGQSASYRIASPRLEALSQECFDANKNRWSLAILSPARTVLGNLELFDERSEEPDQADIAFATYLAEVAAIAIENANYIEALKLARESAQVANQAKSEFLANMSHEIRTPMTAILGYTDVLLNDRNFENDPQQCIQSIQTIQRNGEHLIGIIDDILDLSKIEAGRFSIESMACSPMGIVDEVLSLMAVRSSAKGIILEALFETQLPATIQTDPTRLRQIILNLVSNAIKFTETGSVQVLVRLIPGNVSKVEFDVVDTGLGMTQEQQGVLFQPFVQADTSTTRKFGGTGLGLTISRRLAEMMGGSVSIVKSLLGEGSRFRATISAGNLDAVAMVDPSSHKKIIEIDSKVSESKPNEKPLDGYRILLAEDGPDNQRLISFILKQAGAVVALAGNGEFAVKACFEACDREQPFHVILMDMQMPVMDGYEATSLLRTKGYSGPIVALTAHAMEGDKAKCLNAGCDDYATKPIDRERLIAKITNYPRSNQEFTICSSDVSLALLPCLSIPIRN